MKTTSSPVSMPVASRHATDTDPTAQDAAIVSPARTVGQHTARGLIRKPTIKPVRPAAHLLGGVLPLSAKRVPGQRPLSSPVRGHAGLALRGTNRPLSLAPIRATSAASTPTSASATGPTRDALQWMKTYQRTGSHIQAPVIQAVRNAPPPPPVVKPVDLAYFDVHIPEAQRSAARYQIQSQVDPAHWSALQAKKTELENTAMAHYAQRDQQFGIQPRNVRYAGSMREVMKNVFEDPSHNPALGRGLIFGENHSTYATRKAMIDNLDYFQKRGVSTLYVEPLMRDGDRAAIDAFNLGAPLPAYLRKRLDKYDVGGGVSTAERNAGYTHQRLFEEARARGMKIVPIDSFAANTDFNTPTSLLNYAERRLAAMNYVAEQSIIQRQAANNNAPWIALVGADHGYRTAGVPGLGELTGAPTMSARFASDQGVPNSDYTFLIDPLRSSAPKRRRVRPTT